MGGKKNKNERNRQQGPLSPRESGNGKNVDSTNSCRTLTAQSAERKRGLAEGSGALGEMAQDQVLSWERVKYEKDSVPSLTFRMIHERSDSI